jgi:hypothetical protein
MQHPLAGRSIFIATPTYDEWVSMEHAAALFGSAAYLAQQRIGMSHAILPGNPFLDMARNQLVASFLASDATDMLFVDADVGWDPTILLRVLSHPQEIVGGLVPKRDATRGDSYHMNAMTGVIGENRLFQCKELPTAFMRIKRSAFEKLQAAGHGTPERPFFKIGNAQSEFGEDIYFCRRWCELGEHLWIDSDITFTHRGGKVWRGNFFEHCIKTGVLVQPETSPVSLAA